jgi:TrmH family RNA methyltransferase
VGSSVRFVLVAPQHPGNVGAVARAMKNMGFGDLAIVAPAAWDPEQARWMAPGCDDVLARMGHFATLDEALVGASRVVGTTARHRRGGQPVIDPATLAERVRAESGTTAVLFGREDHGLSEADLDRCEAVLRIPTAEHASLNLAQAALITAWCLRGEGLVGRRLGGTPGAESATGVLDRPDRRGRPADVPTAEPVVAEAVALLDTVGYLRGVDPRRVARTFRRLLQRAGATVREVEALRGMAGRVRWALENPGLDWKATRRPRD